VEQTADAVVDNAGEAFASAGQTVDSVADNAGGMLAPAALSVASPMRDVVSTSGLTAGEDGSSVPPSTLAEHSGGVPESGASARTDNVHNLPGQSGAGSEIM